MSVIKQIFNSFMRGPVYLILFGLIFFGVGAGLSYKQSSMQRAGTQVPGEVVSLDTNCDNDGCAYAPIVSFKTREEKTVTFESTYSSNPPAYEIGEKVTVIYLPDNPEKAVIKGEGTGFRIVFMIVGGLITCVGLGMFSTSVVKSFLKEDT
jgi:hypothetical protein